MERETGDINLKVNVVKKVRIGSRVPDENKDWLQSHGIVTNKIPPAPKKTKKKFFTSHFILLVLGVWAVLSVGIILKQYDDADQALKQSGLRLRSLEFSNHHLLARLERLSELGKAQEFEINRLDFEIQSVRWRLERQIRFLEKQVELESSLGKARDAVEF